MREVNEPTASTWWIKLVLFFDTATTNRWWGNLEVFRQRSRAKALILCSYYT
jgi:hypothetical protein